MKHEITELLPFYANGTLSAVERDQVEAELATCASCNAELREIERLEAALRERAAEAPPLPGDLLGATLSRLDTVGPAPSLVRPLRALGSRWLAAPARYAAAATLVVGFGAVAAAAWHAHEADVAQTSISNVQMQGPVKVYQGTPRPGVAQAQPKMRVSTTFNRPVALASPPRQIPATAQAAVERQHRLAKHAHLEIVVSDVEAALLRAQTIVRGAGGDVTSLNDMSPRVPGTVHGAELDVEVQAERLDATVNRLAQLGTVKNRTVVAEDIGDAIVDEEARLKNLRRAETDLRALMDKRGTVDEILVVQQNLSDVRGQIEQLDARHQRDLRRVATSTIAVSLLEANPNPAPKTGPGARIDGAWQSGVGSLTETLIATISAIVWCAALAPIPLALAAIAYTAVRLLRRRRTVTS